jgi:hypothetical protein
VQFFTLSPFFTSLFHFSSKKKLDTTLEKLKKYFPALPQNAITKIYHAWCEKLILLMNHGITEYIRWLIKAKVRLSGEFSNSFISYMPGTDKSNFVSLLPSHGNVISFIWGLH